jgi:hypothetical protein
MTAEATPAPYTAPARRLANTLAVEQVVDCVTTRAALQGGGHEQNPLSRPFVHTLPACLLTSGLANIALRHVGAKSRVGLTALRLAVGLYPMVLVNNVATIGAVPWYSHLRGVRSTPAFGFSVARRF